jgi:polyhydroxyalkanoate synthesis regulator phasin
MDVEERKDPFASCNTDEIPIFMLEMLEDGSLEEPEAKVLLDTYAEIAPGLPVHEEFEPEAAVDAASEDDEEIRTIEGHKSAVQRLQELIMNGTMSPEDAKRLMQTFAGRIDTSQHKAGDPLSPELPLVPRSSSIVRMKGKVRRNRRLKVEIRSGAHGMNIAEIDDPPGKKPWK